jgi:hypothetical protein
LNDPKARLAIKEIDIFFIIIKKPTVLNFGYLFKAKYKVYQRSSIKMNNAFRFGN